METEYEEPVETTTERAKAAQDRLGWANMDDHHQVVSATLDVARVVCELAGQVATLQQQVALLTRERVTA